MRDINKRLDAVERRLTQVPTSRERQAVLYGAHEDDLVAMMVASCRPAFDTPRDDIRARVIAVLGNATRPDIRDAKIIDGIVDDLAAVGFEEWRAARRLSAPYGREDQ